MFEKGIIEKIGSTYTVYDYPTFIHRMLDKNRDYLGNYFCLSDAITAITCVRVKKLFGKRKKIKL